MSTFLFNNCHLKLFKKVVLEDTPYKFTHKGITVIKESKQTNGVSSNDEKKVIKSHISTIVKNLKKPKPLFFILGILFLLIATTFNSCAALRLTTTYLNKEIDLMYQYQFEDCTFQIMHDSPAFYNLQFQYQGMTDGVTTDDDIQKISKNEKIKYPILLNKKYTLSDDLIYFNGTNNSNNNTMDWRYINGLLEVDETNQDYFKYQKDPRITKEIHFPQNYDEIVISSFKADMFLEYGFIDENLNKLEISNVNDLIGKKISGFTICGIYDYGFSKQEMNHFIKQSKNSFSLIEDIYFLKSTNSYGIVKRGSYENFVYEKTGRKVKLSDSCEVYYKFTGTKSLDYMFLNSFSSVSDFNTFNQKHSGFHIYYASIISPFSYLFHSFYESERNLNIIIIFLILTLLFALLSLIFIFHSLSATFKSNRISFSQKCGNTKQKIFASYIITSLPVLISSFLSSILIQFIMTFIKNAQHTINVFCINGLSILAIFVLLIIVYFIYVLTCLIKIVSYHSDCKDFQR